MAHAPNFLWLVIVGVLVSTLTIVLLFIIINVCISKQVARQRARRSKPNQTNLSHENLFPENADVEQKPPPLPSRDQFLTESMSNSYEEVDKLVEPMKVEIQSSAPPRPLIQHCEIQSEQEELKSVCESYDDVEELNKNESQSYEDVASLPDYLELDEDPPAFQQQPELLNTPNCSRESLASYDDIGELDASEDYDDVG
ncbi:uncharacterized protein [Salminus brasiliensis]|uniref:uncharacterized protein n=1 Tax=Salminus brasiliensis TaxID=930266 RepID=UPI003B836D36